MTLKLAFRYLMGRKYRTVLTTLSIVFGVMIIFGMNGLIPAIEAAFDESVTSSIHQLDLILSHELGIMFDEDRVKELESWDGIDVATPVLEDTLSLGRYKFVNNDSIIEKVIINGVDPITSKLALPLSAEEGRWLESGDQSVMLVRSTFIDKTGYQLGDTVTLPTASGPKTFRIIGVLPKKPTIDNEEIYMTLDDAQNIFNYEGKISAIIGQFSNTVTDDEGLRSNIKDHFGEGYVVGALDAGGNEWEAVIEMGNVIFTVFGLVALAMGGFIMYNTFKISVAERKKDIGMLRTLGAKKKDVLKIVLIEGVVQGIIGTLLGILVGFILLKAMIPIIQPIWKDFFNADLGEAKFSIGLYLMAIVFGVGIPVVSVLGPARKAMEIEPLEAIRPQITTIQNQSFKKRLIVSLGILTIALITLWAPQANIEFIGALLAILALILMSPALVQPMVGFMKKSMKLPNEWLIALSNITRQSKRSANTAITMLISVAIIVATVGMATTFTVGLMKYLDKSMSSDYLIIPEALILGSEGNIGAGDDLKNKIKNIEGVKELTAIRQSDAKAGELNFSMIGVDPDSYERLSGLTFQRGDEKTAYDRLKSGKKIIINGALALQGSYDIGDIMTLTTVKGSGDYEVIGIGIDYLNSKVSTAYISHNNIEEDYNTYNNVMFMVNREEGADQKATEERLKEALENYPSFSVLSYEVWRDFQKQGNETRNFFMYFMMAVLAIPSLIALANNLSMNVIERTREIGMLRAVGMTRKQVKKMILSESLVISLMGVLLGIIGGIWLSYSFVSLMNVSGFVLEFYFPVMGLIISLVVGVLFGILAAVLPVKRATNLDIVEAIAYE